MKTIAYNEVLFRAAEAAGRTRDNLPPSEAAVLRSVFNMELNRVWASEDWDDLRQPILPLTLDANNSFPNPLITQDTSYVIVTGSAAADVNGTYVWNASTSRYVLANSTYSIIQVGEVWQLQDQAAEGVYVSYYTSPTLTGPYNNDQITGDAPTVSYPPANSMPLGEVLGVFNQDPNGSTPWTRFDFYRTGDSYRVTTPLNHPANQVPAVPNTVYVYWQSACPDLLALTQVQLNTLTLPLVFGNYLALLGAGHLLTSDSAPSLAGVQFGLARSDLDFQRTRIKRPHWSKV